MTKGSKEELKNQWIEHSPKLKNFVKSKVGDEFYDDVMSDTYIYLSSKIEDIDVTDFKGLMFNTSKYFISKHLLSNKNNPVVKQLIETEPYFENSVDVSLDDEMLKKLKSVNKLLYLPFEMQINGFSIAQIAELLDTNINTVKTRISRCKEFLRQ